jgi:hypothetical protein
MFGDAELLKSAGAVPPQAPALRSAKTRRLAMKTGVSLLEVSR